MWFINIIVRKSAQIPCKIIMIPTRFKNWWLADKNRCRRVKNLCLRDKNWCLRTNIRWQRRQCYIIISYIISKFKSTGLPSLFQKIPSSKFPIIAIIIHTVISEFFTRSRGTVVNPHVLTTCPSWVRSPNGQSHHSVGLTILLWKISKSLKAKPH